MRFLWITGVALALDQLTKWWVLQTMTLGESVPVLGSFFKLTYIHNPGAVFGIRLGNPYLHLLLACVALIVVGGLLWRISPEDRLAAIGLTLVLGGAIGNIIDRVRFGVVIDFLDFGIGTARWWVFNLADTCVSVGTALLIFAFGITSKHRKTVYNRDSSKNSAPT